MLAIYLFLIATSPSIHFENLCGIMFPREEGGDWGSGAYLLPSDTFNLPIYADTKGNRFGTLYRDRYLRFTNVKGQPQRCWKGFESIASYEVELLKEKWTAKRDYLKVCWLDFEKELYIKKSDIDKIGARYYSYEQYLFNSDLPQKVMEAKSWANVGINLNKSCLNLRELPNKNANKIYCIPGNDWKETEVHHLKIKDYEDQWAYVEVIRLEYDNALDDSRDGCGFAERQRYQGWIKAIADDGFPNIWFSVTAY